jgi:hypothetical protein
MDENFICLADDEEKLDPRIDMTRFLSVDFYDYAYFEKRFPKLPDSVLEMLVEVSRDKIIIEKNQKPTMG